MSLKLPSLFSDHLVLQRAEHVPIWGWAEAGENVTVTLDGESRVASANDDDRWMVEFDLRKKSVGPFELAIEAERSGSFVVRDVIVGEVWLASGQSNMEWPVSKCLGAAEAVAQAGDFRIREFHVDQTSRAEPQEDVPGRWSIATAETVGNFSAVAYAFAQNLERELDGPIGILHSSWGGSRLEAWIPPDRLNAQEAEKAAREQQQLLQLERDRAAYVADYRAWEKRFLREDPGSPKPEKFTAPDADETEWKAIQLPGKLAEQGLPDAGVTWLRKKVMIPAALAHPGMHIHIDVFREFEAFYINGELARETTPSSPQHTFNGGRSFHLPVHLSEGEATIAIRLFSPAGDAEVSGGSFLIEGEVPTGGEWLARNEHVLPPISTETKAAIPQPPAGPPGLQNIPGALFNGMIAPLIPCALAGAIWYQGESNTSETDAPLYAEGFERMIEDWRRRFHLPHLPFYYCQLPEFMPKTKDFARSGWAEFREVQASSQRLPQVGMAVLMGLGESDDIHPRNKLEVGERLARLALARTYGRKVVADAPAFASLKKEGDTLRLFFRNAEGGLNARRLTHSMKRYSPDFVPSPMPIEYLSAGEVQGFAVCGEDRRWVWAEAKIEGDEIVVWSEKVAAPLAVRYAWADNPTCNVFSAEGLPLTPFRTDDFSLAEA